MTKPSEAALAYLQECYEKAPQSFPSEDDFALQEQLQIGDWSGVFKSLQRIRNSESAREREIHYRQMMSHVEPSCMAEELLARTIELYRQARDEADLLASL